MSNTEKDRREAELMGAAKAGLGKIYGLHGFVIESVRVSVKELSSKCRVFEKE